MAHLYIETSVGFISERYIVRLAAKHGSAEWTIFFLNGDKVAEATASAEAAKEFLYKNDPIGR